MFNRRVKRADQIARDFGGKLDAGEIVRAFAFIGHQRPGIALYRAIPVVVRCSGHPKMCHGECAGLVAE